MKELKIKDLKVGMILDGGFRRYDFVDTIRIEYVAYDWAVARDEYNHLHLITKNSNIKIKRGIINDKT